jgi:hypothetical protein
VRTGQERREVARIEEVADRRPGPNRRGRGNRPGDQERREDGEGYPDEDRGAPVVPESHSGGRERRGDAGGLSADPVGADGPTDRVEFPGQQRRRGIVVDAGTDPQQDQTDAEREERGRGRETERRERGGPQRDENDPALAEPVREDAARELREGVDDPHAGERRPERAAGDAERLDDGGDDRADDDLREPDAEVRANAGREERVSMAPPR